MLRQGHPELNPKTKREKGDPGTVDVSMLVVIFMLVFNVIFAFDALLERTILPLTFTSLFG